MEYEQHPKYWDMDHQELREAYAKISKKLDQERSKDFKVVVCLYSAYVLAVCAIIVVCCSSSWEVKSIKDKAAKTYKK